MCGLCVDYVWIAVWRYAFSVMRGMRRNARTKVAIYICARTVGSTSCANMLVKFVYVCVCMCVCVWAHMHTLCVGLCVDIVCRLCADIMCRLCVDIMCGYYVWTLHVDIMFRFRKKLFEENGPVKTLGYPGGPGHVKWCPLLRGYQEEYALTELRKFPRGLLAMKAPVW